MVTGLCPACWHPATEHIGIPCREKCGTCSWVIMGEGNAWGVAPGWHRTEDIDTIADVEAFLGYRVPHVRFTARRKTPPK